MPLPAVGFAPQTSKTSVLRVGVTRLSLGGFQSQYSGESFEEQLYVRLRPSSWQGEQRHLYLPCLEAGKP